MKKLKLDSTKTLVLFEEFIARNRFQFPDGVYPSCNGGTFHLSLMNNPLLQKIIFSDNLSGKILLPVDFAVEKHRLIEPASCIDIQSEIGWKRTFTTKTFLATVWSLLYEQGENLGGFIPEECLFLFHVSYPDGAFDTASLMLMNIGAYYEYSINMGNPKIYEDTWSVNSSESRGTYLLVPAKNQEIKKV